MYIIIIIIIIIIDNIKRYVDINQPLDRLPKCAVEANSKTSEDVLKMLETCPQAPRTELAHRLHIQWLDTQDSKVLSLQNKLRKGWSELPMNERLKNMVIVDAVCSCSQEEHL
jgi:hypothetical protein